MCDDDDDTGDNMLAVGSLKGMIQMMRMILLSIVEDGGELGTTLLSGETETTG